MPRSHQRRPRFCLEMLEAALIDTDFRHRVVTADVGPDEAADEWIEVEAPTDLYTNADGEQLLTVTIRVEDGAVRMLATDVYPSGSLRSPTKPSDRPDGSRQVLWLTNTRLNLTVELVAAPLGRLDAVLNLDGVRAFNRADVPRFVRSFASGMDLVEQMIRDTGLRVEPWGN